MIVDSTCSSIELKVEDEILLAELKRCTNDPKLVIGLEAHYLTPLVRASDCIPCLGCRDPWCEKHGLHYYECDCIGPDEAEEHGLVVIEIDGQLYGLGEIPS